MTTINETRIQAMPQEQRTQLFKKRIKTLKRVTSKENVMFWAQHQAPTYLGLMTTHVQLNRLIESLS